MPDASPPVAVTPAALLDRVRARGADLRTCLVAVGQWPAKIDDAWADRIGVLSTAARPQTLADAWVLRSHRPALAAAFEVPELDGWDVMFATPWRTIWGGRPFGVWSRRARRLTVLGPGRAETQFLRWTRTHDVAAVCAEISPDWATHRVGLRTTTDERIWVARRRELAALIDPTYDGLCLLADVGWASDLGARLARELRVPYEWNDDTLKPTPIA